MKKYDAGPPPNFDLGIRLCACLPCACPEQRHALYSQAIAKAHAAGKRIIGIPILPFGGSVKDVGDNVQVAQDVNAWIRAHDRRSGAAEPSFDAVIDFESVIGDPDAGTWSPRADMTCDKVHPNQAGYRALAASIPLDVFQ